MKRNSNSFSVQSVSGQNQSKDKDIFKYYETWKTMVDNVDTMIKETLATTEPNSTNTEVLESLKRRHLLFESVRSSFDVQFKKNLLAFGSDMGDQILAWAKASFLKKLNAAVQAQAAECKSASCVSSGSNKNTLQSVVKKDETTNNSLDRMASDEDFLTEIQLTNKRRSRAARFNEVKTRLEARQEVLAKKREELRKQRLSHTNPSPTKLTESDRVRICERLDVIKKREQNIINVKRSYGTIRKLVVNVGGNLDKVAEMSRSMLRKGKVDTF